MPLRKIALLLILGAFSFASAGCAALAVGAGGAYVYGQHETNKENRRRQ